MTATISPKYLSLQPEHNSKHKTFLENSFAIRLKPDFQMLYLENYYTHNGLDEEATAKAKRGELVMDKSTQALLSYFRFIEQSTLAAEAMAQ